MNRTIPVIDLAPFIDGSDRERVVREIDDACRGLGFLVIKGHGVPKDLIASTLAAAESFFARDQEEKAKYAVGPSHGYQQFANMSLSQSYSDKEFPPDLREALTLRRRDAEGPGHVWTSPVEQDENVKAVLGSYYRELNRVADTLLEIFELALGTEPRYLRDRSDNHDSNLSLYHYPPMAQPPLPGQVRGGEHTDFGSITIVLGAPSIHGLEIRSGDEWEPAPIVPDTFVVNIGDLMAQWTNDLWNSTIHRVANPVDGDWDKARYSIVFFHQPDYDAVIESLDKANPAKYPPVTSGEHFHRKAGAMFAGINL
ncbi:isopenicillin N synthase family dioxygenase [Rhodococcus pyridinivorans]